MYITSQLEQLVDVATKQCVSLSNDEMLFCKRMYATLMDTYMKRLQMLNFHHMERVLDAGCGFGQWSFALLNLDNLRVDACDISQSRVNTLSKILEVANEQKIVPVCSSLEKLPYDDCSFDSIFSYGVIHMTNVLATLQEFYRVLKPGGKLYFTANALGYYIYCWQKDARNIRNLTQRMRVAQTLINTAAVAENKSRPYPVGIVIEQSEMLSLLKQAGFGQSIFAEDGNINFFDEEKRPLFVGKYHTMDAVYEVLVNK